MVSLFVVQNHDPGKVCLTRHAKVKKQAGETALLEFSTCPEK
jgi:hypothetical protein